MVDLVFYLKREPLADTICEILLDCKISVFECEGDQHLQSVNISNAGFTLTLFLHQSTMYHFLCLLPLSTRLSLIASATNKKNVGYIEDALDSFLYSPTGSWPREDHSRNVVKYIICLTCLTKENESLYINNRSHWTTATDSMCVIGLNNQFTLTGNVYLALAEAWLNAESDPNYYYAP